MRLSKYIQTLTRPELEEVINDLNLTDDEEQIIRCLAKGKSNIQIADTCCCSLATIGIRISNINTKLQKITKGGLTDAKHD